MNILFFGLGRIGLPQSVVFSEAGHKVYGFDTNRNLLQQLLRGEMPFEEIGLLDLFNKNINKNLFVVPEWESIISDIDCIIFTLGTKAPNAKTCLLEEDGDLTDLKAILRKIFDVRKGLGRLILVFRTTLFLGSTEKLRDFLQNKLGLRDGLDFLIAFVPERLVEGNAIHEERFLPKIVGSTTDQGSDVVADLFRSIGGDVISVKSTKTAEFCKLTDNSYRNTMFSFANELAMWAMQNSVNIHEVIEAVNFKYGRNNIPSPGFVSGYCLGKDPYIFEYKFNKNKILKRDFQSLWFYGRRTNDYLVQFAKNRILNGLNKMGVLTKDAKILVLGLSFKKDVDDFRMSHAFDLIVDMHKSGVREIIGSDPKLGINSYTAIPENIQSLSNFISTSVISDGFIKDVDALVISTPHTEYLSLPKIIEKNKSKEKPMYVFDAWNICPDLSNIDGVIYESLGAGHV